MIIVNQQRAHQRILYEDFKNIKSENLKSQKLIFPQTIHLTKKEIHEISNIVTELKNVGFKFNIHEESIEINSVPLQCMEKNLKSIFDEILQENELEQNDLKEKFRTKLSKTLSKTLGIKSGRKLNQEEMRMIVLKLMKCEIPSVSPYGLTTYFNVTNDEIIKKFN